MTWNLSSNADFHILNLTTSLLSVCRYHALMFQPLSIKELWAVMFLLVINVIIVLNYSFVSWRSWTPRGCCSISCSILWNIHVAHCLNTGLQTGQSGQEGEIFLFFKMLRSAMGLTPDHLGHMPAVACTGS